MEIGRTRLQPVRQIYVRSPVISLVAVPQQQQDREIIGADTLLGACPAGAQCIAADPDLMGKEEDRGSPVLIFPSNPSASTVHCSASAAAWQVLRGRRWKTPSSKRVFASQPRSSQKLCVSRSCYSVGREEHTVCNVIYFRPHWPLICLLLVFLWPIFLRITFLFPILIVIRLTEHNRLTHTESFAE